jgi:hypothetical protein
MMERMDESAAAPSPTTSPRASRIPLQAVCLALLVVGVTWWWGYLPWVLDGFHPDRLSTVPGATGEGLGDRRLPIPFVAGELVTLVAFTTVGALSATLLPIAFLRLPRSVGVAVSGLVMLVTVLALASVARSMVSSKAAGYFAGDSRVGDGLFVGVLAIAVLCAALGALACWQNGFLPLAIAVLLSQLDVWLVELGIRDQWFLDLVTIALLSVAFVISVRRSVRWALLWPVVLVVFLAQAPFGIALQVVTDRLGPGKKLEGQLGDILAQARQVFSASFWHVHRSWWPELVALGIGVVWLVVQRRRASPDR